MATNNSFNNPFAQISKNLQQFIRQDFGLDEGPATAEIGPVPPPKPYTAVRPTDRDPFDIASRTGTDINQIMQLNGGLQTLPPVGTRLATQPYQYPSPIGPKPQVGPKPPNSTQSFYYNQYNKPTVSPVDDGRGAGMTTAQLVASRKARGLMNYAATTGNPPKSIPLETLPYMKNSEGNNLTLNMALDMGYVLVGGNLVYSGTPGRKENALGVGVPTGGGADEYARVNSGGKYQTQREFLNDTRFYKGKYVKIGELIRRGLLDVRTGRTYDTGKKRNKKGKLVNKNRGNKDVPQDGPAFRNGPESILDIHLGSG